MTMDIELKGITKRFGSVIANDQINLQIKAGEVLGLLGENGAGKSTLMNILSGLYAPDEGKLLIDGIEVNFRGPGDSISAGIGMVHQHFMLVPIFSVAENVILGVEPIKTADYLDLSKARTLVNKISSEYGLSVPPDAIIEDLPVGIQQKVEIIKVLFREANVIIFDEPTAVLTPSEVEDFFSIVRALKASGKAIVFITHKLHEIKEIADRVTVLRHGRVTGEGNPKRLTKEKLAEMMVGRQVSFTVNKIKSKIGHPILKLDNVELYTKDNERVLKNINFSINAGEIVGVAGIQGNGQTELIEVITGLRKNYAGEMFLGELDITKANARQRHIAGMAHIPEDRHKFGMVENFSITENIIINNYYENGISNFITINWKKARSIAELLCEEFDVRTPSVELNGKSLSGGNQQKMVVARELGRKPKIVIAAQPTRGVDVGSIEYIHSRLVQSRDDGNGVLLVSSELDEIISLSDRILVMYDGSIVAEFDNTDAKPKRNQIGLAMAGSTEEIYNDH